MIPDWRQALLAGCFVVAGMPAAAQMTSPTMSDATVVTRGVFRVRGEVHWTRVNGAYGPGSSLGPLGGSLTGELTSSTLPLLAGGEVAARLMAVDPALVLSAGRLTTSADSRIATVPLTIEYGLTSRLTLGAVVPVVQSRTVITSQLNGPGDSVANAGTNPARFHQSGAAYAANAAVYNGLTSARDQLASRLSTCAASPFASGCPALNARSAEANALVNASNAFTSALGTLYGVAPDVPGAPFVPLAGSAAQAAIDARLAALRAGFASFGFSGGTGALAAAQAAAANAQLAVLLSDPEFGIELDSIGTTEQTTIGDIELSVTSLVFNSFGSARGLRLRGVVAGVVRLGTGHAARANRPFDVPTGDGQMDFEGRAAVDAMVGRLLTTVAATYTAQTGTVPTTRLPAAPGSFFSLDFPVAGSVKLGNMMSARVNPRFMITPALMVGALGIASRNAADEVTVTGFAPDPAAFTGRPAITMVTGGVTVSYSNLATARGTGGRGFPAEIVFSHLQTLSASGAGAMKATRDAIELRFYLRAR